MNQVSYLDRLKTTKFAVHFNITSNMHLEPEAKAGNGLLKKMIQHVRYCLLSPGGSTRKYPADIKVKFPDTYALVGQNITLECFALGK